MSATIRRTSYDEYASARGLRSSVLRALGKSPAHARAAELEPSEATPAQTFGQAYHTAVLEPNQFNREYVVAPRIDKRTKAGREAWAKVEELAKGRTILKQDDFDKIENMKKAAWDHPVAGPILQQKSPAEISVFWTDAETGLHCKARLDKTARIGGDLVIVDLKTTADASPFAFSRAVARYGYHLQAGYYRIAAQASGSSAGGFAFIAQEKETPYAVAVYRLADTALSLGEDAMRNYMRIYKRCLDAGEWPGYDEIQTVDVPKWEYQTDFEEVS